MIDSGVVTIGVMDRPGAFRNVGRQPVRTARKFQNGLFIFQMSCLVYGRFASQRPNPNCQMSITETEHILRHVETMAHVQKARKTSLSRAEPCCSSLGFPLLAQPSTLLPFAGVFGASASRRLTLGQDGDASDPKTGTSREPWESRRIVQVWSRCTQLLRRLPLERFKTNNHKAHFRVQIANNPQRRLELET